MPRVYGVAGFSGSGKTTLVATLLREFATRGLAVATIKHAEKFDGEPAGKDGAVHRAAGAAGTLVVAPDGMRLSLPPAAHATPAALARRFFPDADLVLLEGFKAAAHPKLFLLRPGEARPPEAARAVAAVILRSGEPHPAQAAPLPHFPADRIAAIADFILDAPLELPAAGVAVRVDGRPLPMKGFVRDMVGNVCRGLVAALKLPGGAASFRDLEIAVRAADGDAAPPSAPDETSL